MSDRASSAAPVSPAALEEKAPAAGTLFRVRAEHRKTLGYHLYLPTRLREDRPLLVAVHGISRNAGEHARAFARWAEGYGAAVLAPRFSRRRFSDYQRLGRAARGRRADLALLSLLDELRARTGLSGEKLFLFGYSGGAQFAHRFALAYPERVARLAVAAAGWYTFPDAGLAYPRGVGAAGRPAGMHFSISAFLRIPICVLVGECDTRRDAELRTTRKVDRDQGLDRVERARRWAAALDQSAARQGVAATVRFELLPGSDHSFTRSDHNGDLTRRVCEFFFERSAIATEVSPSSLL